MLGSEGRWIYKLSLSNLYTLLGSPEKNVGQRVQVVWEEQVREYSSWSYEAVVFIYLKFRRTN